MEVEGRYQKGRASVDEYVEQTIIANPHVKLTYLTPEGDTKEYPRTYHELPPAPREIKPHPYGIELGMLLKMLQDTKSHSLSGFLASDFSRVSPRLAADICKAAGLSARARPRDIHGQASETLYKAIQSTKIMAPPTNCLSPVGEKALLYQQSACVIYKSVLDTTWRNYGVSQSKGALPSGPMVVFAHMASVWVPFTSESKEAIADYDEIRKEITLALRECGRRLGAFLRRRERAHSEFRRRNIFELYIEEVVESCNRLKGGRLPTAKLKAQLQRIAMRRTGGEKTDELLGKNGGGPEGLPHSIIVTPEGVEGEVPVLIGEAPGGAMSPNGAPEDEAKAGKPSRPRGKTTGRATRKRATATRRKA